MRKKIGFVLKTKNKLSGALLQNWEVFEYLKKQKLSVGTIIPPTQYFADNLPVIGSIINYFTVYPERKKFHYCVATSVAGVPFIEGDTKLISLFHSLDSVAVDRVLNTLSKEAPLERKNREKIIKQIEKIIISDQDELEMRKKTHYIAEAACIEKSKAVICVSNAIKKDIQNNFKNTAKKEIAVISNGIPDYFFNARKINQIINTNEVNLIFNSRVPYTKYTVYEKGVDRILRISQKIGKNNKIFIGAMPDDKKIANFWKALFKYNKIQLVHDLPRKKIPSYLRKGDIFIQCSRSEAFGLALAEAMASGLVPVAYPEGIATEVIKNGETGFLVNSINQARDKIEFLIKNKDERLGMSNKCIELAKKKFSYKIMMDKYYDFFKQL